MGKRAQVILVILAGFLIVLFLKLYLMVGTVVEINATPDPLETAISQTFNRYEHKEISVVNLSTVTSFAWDRLYVFGGYTPLSDLDSTVGRSWRKVCTTQIDVLEGYALLVFVKDKKVVHCLEYPTEKYDFSSLAKYESGLQIQESLFVLDKNGYVVLAKNK